MASERRERIDRLMNWAGSFRRRANFSNFIFNKELFNEGLAGKEEAREAWERKRVVLRSSLPQWAIDHIHEIASRYSQVKKLSGSTGKIVNNPRLYAYLYSLSAFSLKGAMKRVERNRLSAERWDAKASRKADSRIYYHYRNMAHLFRQKYEGLREVFSFMAKAIALQDFLYLHPVDLPDHKLLKVAREAPDHWAIVKHPTIAKILELERKMDDVFAFFSATPVERSAILSVLLRKSSGAKRKDVIDWFEHERNVKMPIPKETTQPSLRREGLAPPDLTPGPQLPSAKRLVKEFLKGHLTHLDSDNRNLVARRMIAMDRLGLMDVEESIQKLAEYTGKDHDHFIDLIYHSFMRDGVLEGKEAEIAVPSAAPELEIEPTESILNRINEANRVRYSDISLLRRRLYRGEIRPGLKPEAIRHILLFRLARGTQQKKLGSKRILLDRVPHAYLPPGLVGAGKDVVKLLVSEGIIVKRENEKIPGNDDNVKIAPHLLFKYKPRE